MARTTAALLTLALMITPAFAQRQKPPLPKLEVVQPAAGQEVSGEVDLRVKVVTPPGAKPPTALYLGLGGAPWMPLQRVEGEDEWTGKIDTTMAPNGERALMFISDNKRVKTVARVVAKNPLRVFFAGLHSHTGYSDGTLTPAIAHQYARDVAKLDVFSLTDHLESVDEREWIDTREVAWDFNEDGRFVVIPGLEWTKKWGHVNIFDPKTRHWPEDPKAFYEAVASADVVAKFNHPGDGSKSHAGLAYSAAGDKAIQMMEVRSEKEEPAFIRALDNGWHIAPEGSDDTHSADWGNRGTWTGILAPGLSKRNVWDAMKQRRLYSTRDRNCVLSFTVNGAVMGSIVEKPVDQVAIVVSVEDPDAQDATAKIELFEDGQVCETDEPGAAKREWQVTRSPKPGKHYYFAKVTQKDGNPLWSAPVWVTVVGK